MEFPRDPWLQQQIEQYRAGNVASTAFFQQAASLLFAQQLVAAGAATRRRRLRSFGCLLHRAFSRLARQQRRRYQRTRGASDIIEGVVISSTGTPENDTTGPTVIVIGLQPTKGE